MSDREQIFFEKCQRGSLSEVQSLLNENINPNTVQSLNVKDGSLSKEMSALCVAALEGNLEVTKILIKNGANVNYRCKLGESALFLAARRGHQKVAQCLLEAGASPVYTAKPGEKVLYENWEVFTQALQNAYPHDISKPCNSSYKGVVQLLLEHNANSQRPTTLYEALYCSLTVFANPIAVYCVGAYSSLCSDLPALIFSEEHFLSALCRAFDMSRVCDFLNTVTSILESSKLRQKDVAQHLAKHFKWGDLLRRLADDSSHYHSTRQLETCKIMEVLMKVLQMLLSHFNVRSDIQDQFISLSVDDMGRIGRMIKFTLDFQTGDGTNDVILKDKNPTWQFLFYLLKQQLRSNQGSSVARLLLRPGGKRNLDGVTSSTGALASQSAGEFERKVLLWSLDNDISLTHMLLDFGVHVNGECFVKFVQCGHLDLVNRCASDRELIFCKEVEVLIRTPITTRSSSNRNLRRCLKVIKCERNIHEEMQSKLEEELLMDEKVPLKGKRKRRAKAKKQQLSSLPEVLESGLQEEGTSVEDVATSHGNSSGDNKSLEEIREKEKENNCVEKSKVKNGVGDGSYVDASAVNGRAAAKKNKRKKKNGGKKKSTTKSEEAENSEEKTTPKCLPVTSEGWREIIQATSRRRRQSSSSSDCSIGSKKSVHFSHPLVFYENRKSKNKSPNAIVPANAEPKASNLKKDTCYDLSESYRTNQSEDKPTPILNGVTKADQYFISNANCFDNDCDGNLSWKCESDRWAPRFEDLSEMEAKEIRQLQWRNSKDEEETVYFCDQQKHLNIGSGPDFTNVYLGLTGKGCEVAIKKISSKRGPVLARKEETTKLLALTQHKGVNKYYAVIRAKSHCYLLQQLGEYSLEKVIRKKVVTLPCSLPQLCLQVASGLAYLHKHGVLHMALKPSNIFLGVDGELRLADYGIHKREAVNFSKSTLGNTSSAMCWMAREVASVDKPTDFTVESDVASLGMVFYYILTGGSHPYGDRDSASCLNNIARGSYNIKSLTDPFAHHLVKNMIGKDVERRFTMKQVLKHPFFWEDGAIDDYITALTEVVLSAGVTDAGRNLREEIVSMEEELMTLYSKKDHLVGVPDVYLSSIKGVFTLLYDCMHNHQIYEQYTLAEVRASASSPQRYFSNCFPGILLKTHESISSSDLEEAMINWSETSSPCSMMDECDTQVAAISALLSDGLPGLNSHYATQYEESDEECEVDSCEAKLYESGKEAKEDLSKQGGDQLKPDQGVKEVDADSPEAKEIDLNSPKPTTPLQMNAAHFVAPEVMQSTNEFEILLSSSKELLDQEVKHANKASSKDKKNTNLCLLDTSCNNSSERNSLSSANKLNSDMAKLNLHEHEDWVNLNHGTDNESNGTNINEDGVWSDVESPDVLHSNQLASPDDWIDVGSPLEQETYSRMKPIINKNKDGSTGFRLCDDSPESSSSGCSVDDCFDFGRYGDPTTDKLDSSVFEILEPKKPCEINTAGNFTNCTDIDELD